MGVGTALDMYCDDIFSINNASDFVNKINEQPESQPKSAFEDNVVKIFQDKENESNFINHKLKEFRNFIKRRVDYLKSLNDLPDDWISGYSRKPKVKAITNSISLLKTVESYLISENTYNRIELMMSPIPNGDVSMQLESDSDYLIINIEEDVVEFEVCKDSHFFDLNSAAIYETEKIIKNLDRLFNG